MKSTKIIAAIACSFCGSVVASDVSVYGMVDAMSSFTTAETAQLST